MLLTNNGIHAANTQACQPGGCSRNQGDGRKLGSIYRASARIAAVAVAIAKRPPMAQMTSPRLMALSLSRFVSERRSRFGSSRHVIAQPHSRMGTRTNAVPLTYQPMIGEMPNVSRSQGITAITVSHNSIEKAPKIEVEAVSPIGGTACICDCMSSIQFIDLCRRMLSSHEYVQTFRSLKFSSLKRDPA